MNVKLIFLFLLILQSCAYFVNTFDENRLAQDIIAYRPGEKKLFCEENASVQLVNSDKVIQEVFEAFITQVEKGARLKFVDKAVLWSMVQMNMRPDQVSPTSKLQILIKSGKEFDYLHFFSKDDEAFPYLAGLEDLLKRYKSRHSLLTLANFVDAYFPNQFTVSEDFEKFLEEQKSSIAANPTFKKYYMRADETLKENERIYKYKLANLVRLHKSKGKGVKHELAQSLFTYKSPSTDLAAHCNYDMRLYSSSVYLIHKDFIRSHLFGLKAGGNNLFLASASQRLENIEPVGQSPFFKGASQTRSAAFCAFEFPRKTDKSLWMVSSDSRDPGQHIYHLMEYGLNAQNTTQDISALIGFSRHLFLEDPTRLVFESNRSTKEQLERLLKLNLPVYNARSLGNVWAMLEEKNHSNFIIDDRTDGEITCAK